MGAMAEVHHVSDFELPSDFGIRILFF